MMGAGRPEERVNLISALLEGAWRPAVPAADCSPEELESITPLLLETGAAAIAWRRVRDSELAGTVAASQLHDTYRLYRLLAVIYERTVAEVFKLLRSHSIEPIMVKGWAVARHYAEPGVRPCGDLDLCVRKEQHAAAFDLLKSRVHRAHSVDLHKEFRYLDYHAFDELMARSRLVELEGVGVRMLSAEDHLRVLCYHFLREGGWRPLWLCDIAVALESRPEDFDWDLCLGSNRRRADWAACAIKLAHILVGATMHDAPLAVRNARLPGWLMPSILRQWEVRSMSQRHRSPMSSTMSHPIRTLKGLRHHWPTPVEATVVLGASFNEMPRLPLQAIECLSRAGLLLARLSHMRRG